MKIVLTVFLFLLSACAFSTSNGDVVLVEPQLTVIQNEDKYYEGTYVGCIKTLTDLFSLPFEEVHQPCLQIAAEEILYDTYNIEKDTWPGVIEMRRLIKESQKNGLRSHEPTG